jgi:ABC-type glycerol-3-phosphate transport system permease component
LAVRVAIEKPNAIALPVLLAFALFQRYFIQGVALTGIKG